MKIDKVLNPGRVKLYNGAFPVFVHVQFDGTKLSISGVEGPKSNGDARGSCGQIDMGYAHRNEADNDKRYSAPTRLASFEKGWSEELWFDLLDVWKRWHLNDLQPACEHQRALGWKYDDHHDPKTFKGEACPTCGYSIGSKWLTEEVPGEVLAFLESLPVSKVVPAWV